MKNRIVRLCVTGVLLLSFILPVSVIPAQASALQAPASISQAAPVRAGAQQPVPPSPLGDEQRISATASLKAAAQPNQPTRRVYGETDPAGVAAAVYMVQLQAPPLASYRGGIDDLRATSPAVTSAGIDVNSSAASAYLGYLSNQQAAVLAEINELLGRPVEVRFTYQVAINGFALVMTPVEAAKVVRMDGVQRVQRDALDHPQGWPTEFGAAWIEAPGIWGGGYAGEGIVAGIIDTGINFGSPSFARVGLDGYVHTNPRGKFFGVCDPTSEVYRAAFTCNDKLIGAWDFADGVGEPADGPADNDGHGSHTASTVAGNFASASLVAPSFVYNAPVSGVAPHANVIAYDACGLAGCATSSLVAAINQAVADNVDVINYSIGGGSRDPWQSMDALAFLGALDAGIYVSVSAGNEGPGASTMGSPANAPWITAVAASTANRRFTNGVSNMTGGTGAPADITGQSITGAYGPAAIVYAGNYTSTLGEADPKCVEPFEPGTFSGQIVVCDRGINGRAAKSYNVQAGGAGGYVLANDEASGASLVADAYAIPGVHITYADGQTLKAWLAGGGNTTATINGTVPDVNDAYGDILASFSSRGPDASQPGVLKPDVAAPGVDIFAAYHTGIEYNVLSGTSMASPHNAGAGALLRGIKPTWSPSEIRSALMLTSKPFLFADETPTLFKDDGVTPADPFDVGAGRIDALLASQVGFVLDENAYDFQVAEPGAGGDPRTLNLASLADQQCVGQCVWTRTLKSVLAAPMAYAVTTKAPVSMTLAVEPNAFTLQPGGTQVITITANVGAAALENWVFGRIDIKPDIVAATLVQPSDAHLPVAVYTRAGAARLGVNEVTIGTRRNQGMVTLEGIRAINTPALVKALYVGASETITGFIAQDPTNGDPYDINNGGVFVDLVSITDPTVARFGVGVIDTTALDLDLFVGIDENGDGQPSPDEELCMSASASAFEFCALDDPEVGDYWVLLQNWQGSGAPLDFFEMEYTQVSRSNQSPDFTVSGPASAALNVPFDLRLNWNFSAMNAGNVRLALLEVGTGPGNASNNILSLPVTLERLNDDVRLGVTVPSGDGSYAQPGDELTYAIRVYPEPTAPNPVNYTVTATLPSGLTYLPGSGVVASGEQHLAVDPIVNGNQLVWTLNGLQTEPEYVMSTNDPESPIYSENCATPFGDQFLHLAGFGIPLVSTIDGNGKSWNLDTLYGAGSAYNFYGSDYPLLFFTDDALLSVVGYDPALNTGVNAPIPTAARPNALLAPYWADFKVVYDEDEGTGVRIAGAGSGALMFVEYDGLQRNDGQPGSFDVQAVISRQPDPDFPEIVFAYDNIVGALPTGVTGVENSDGTAGVAYTGALSDNLLVCYDWTQQPATVTYQAEVKTDAPLNAEQMTTVRSSTNAPGSGVATTQNELFITGVVLEMAVSGPSNMLPSLPVTYTLTVTNSGTVAAQNLMVMAELPFGTQHVAGGVEADGVVTFQIATLAAGASTQLQYSVRLVDVPSPVLAASVRTPAIIGGNPADPGEYPWQVAVMSAATDEQFCGGSLISPWWVATAAHCVNDETIRSIYVVAGRTDLSTTEGQEIGVARIAVHPGYDIVTADNDIALLHLAEPAVLTTTVQPIPVAGRLDAPLFGAGVMATVTGWGSRSADTPDYPDALYEVAVPMVDQTACVLAYATIGDAITSNMICAGLPQGGKDSCYGDSGGPLIVPDPAGGFKLAGVVSWGNSCALPGFPGVYTRISNYNDWIATEQGTLTSGRYLVTDRSGNPGHSYLGSEVITTVVRQILQWLVPVSKQYNSTR